MKKNGRFGGNQLLADAIKENEKRANGVCSFVFLILVAICLTTLILNTIGVFRMYDLSVKLYSISLIIMAFTAVCIRFSGFSSLVIKRIVLTSIVLTSLIFDAAGTHNVPVAMSVPVLMSAMYFDKWTVTQTSIVTAALFGIETYVLTRFPLYIDLNHVNLEDGTVMTIEGDLEDTIFRSYLDISDYVPRMMLFDYLPKLLNLAIIVGIAHAMVRFGQNMLIKQAESVAGEARMNAELDVARQLQKSALPDVSKLNGKYNFELAASMKAARQTGGDFYDFMMLDKNHLAVAIADVSGKGIPASMFMMSAKAVMRNACSGAATPAEAVRTANMNLFEGNDGEMFVTAWIGVVELNSRVMTSVNAGHQNPIVYIPGEEYVEVCRPHDLIMGMFENAEYTDVRSELQSGLVLFLYTDGVTEGQNAKGEMFGTERLLECLNRKCRDEGMSAEDIRKTVKNELVDFAGGAEQFDDITMLVLKML